MMVAVMLGMEWAAISCVDISSLNRQLQRLPCIDCKFIGQWSNQLLKQAERRNRWSRKPRCFVSESLLLQNATSAGTAGSEASEGGAFISDGLVIGTLDAKEEVIATSAGTAGSEASEGGAFDSDGLVIGTPDANEVVICSTPELEVGSICQTDGVKDETADDKFCQMRTLCKEGKLKAALNLVDEHGLRLDVDACGFLLKCAIKKKALVEGRRIREHLTKRGLDLNTYLRNNVVRMYSECKQMELARQEFDSMSRQTILSWTTIIAGYAVNDQGREALHVFQIMLEKGIKPDGQLLVTVLNTVAKLRSLEDAKRIHALIVEKEFGMNLFILNSVVDMYGKCGDMASAHEVFAGMLTRDVVTWNAIIAGYASKGHGQMALELYKQMGREGVKPNEVTFVCLLKACSGPADLSYGKLIHQRVTESGFESHVVSGTAVLDMYIKCGSILDARLVFRRLSKRDVVSWTAMIMGCNRCGLHKEACDLFWEMRLEQIKPNRFTHGAVLTACAKSGAEEEGRLIHAYLKKQGLELDVAMGTNLVYMYASFGKMQEARQLFDRMPKKIIVSWAMLIAGYVQVGCYDEPFQLFNCMLQEGLKPNESTFINLLNACAGQSGLETGKWLQAEAVKALPQPTGAIEEAILSMYSRCRSSLEKAPTELCKLTAQYSTAASLEKWEYITTVKGEEAEQLLV